MQAAGQLAADIAEADKSDLHGAGSAAALFRREKTLAGAAICAAPFPRLQAPCPCALDRRRRTGLPAAVATGKVGPAGCVGYCLSGQFVYTVAARYPDEIAAAASYYGAGIVTDRPDSPHLAPDAIQAEPYLAFAEDDPWVPDSM
ncbi:MAG: hypothetical protein F4027_14345, partial [Rhodospirillaceae bacterium]|nr:hypothetical protein [Rhodospirillaceae bacterium]